MNAYNGITGMQEARNDEWSAEKIVYNMDVDPSSSYFWELWNVDFTIYILGGLFYLEKWLYL